jgi:hypothetical protein
MQDVEWLPQKEPLVLSRFDDAALGEKIQCRTDGRPRNADEIRELLLAKVMARLHPRVTNDVENLVGQAEPGLLGRSSHSGEALRYGIIRFI